jgi:hypothetical protein
MKEINSLQQMHRDGRINRRDFLKVMGALGFSAMAANELLTASTVLAGTPVKGGTVIMANNIHGPDDQMDPIVFTSGIDYQRGICTYNGLIQILDDMSLHPELAADARAEVAFIRDTLRAAGVDGPIAIEVEDEESFRACLVLEIEIILVDNVPPELLEQWVSRARKDDLPLASHQIEASGGIDETSVAAYAAAGAGRISCGAITPSTGCPD